MKNLLIVLIGIICLNTQAQDYELPQIDLTDYYSTKPKSNFGYNPNPLIDLSGYYENPELSYRPTAESFKQKTLWDKWGKSAAVFAWQVSSTALNAVGDGLNHNGNKEWGHFCNATAYAMYMSGPFVLNINRSEWAPYLVGCVIARFVFFDPIHNLVIGEDLGYVGNSSFYDKAVQELGAPEHGWLFARAVFLSVKVSIDIKYW